MRLLIDVANGLVKNSALRYFSFSALLFQCTVFAMSLVQSYVLSATVHRQTYWSIGKIDFMESHTFHSALLLLRSKNFGNDSLKQNFTSLCLLPESNWGPFAYKANALTTLLSRHAHCMRISIIILCWSIFSVSLCESVHVSDDDSNVKEPSIRYPFHTEDVRVGVAAIDLAQRHSWI